MLGFIASPAFVPPLPAGHADADLHEWLADRHEPTADDLAELALAEAVRQQQVARLIAACRDALACDFTDGGACCELANAVAAFDGLNR